MENKLTLLAIVATSVMAGAYAVNYINNQMLESQTQLLLQTTDALEAKITQLQKENTQLRQQLMANKNIPTTAPSTAISIQPASPVQSLQTNESTTPNPKDQLLDEQSLRTSENFSAWLAKAHEKTGSFNLHDEMQRRFDDENTDPIWAEKQEQEYLTLFNQNPELAGLALRDVRCRTQQCALTISISDIHHANNLPAKLSKILKEQQKYPMIVATPDEQQGITILYIEKDINTFEFN